MLIAIVGGDRLREKECNRMIALIRQGPHARRLVGDGLFHARLGHRVATTCNHHVTFLLWSTATRFASYTTDEHDPDKRNRRYTAWVNAKDGS